MRGSVIAVAVAALLTHAALARAEWRIYTYKADGFELELPSVPKIAPVPLNSEARQRLVRATNYIVDAGNAQYLVVATLTNESPNFQSGVDRSIAGLKCRSTSSNRALQSPHGPARQIFASDCVDGSYLALVRYFQRGKWFYAVLALVKKSPQTSNIDNALRFLTSFKLIGQP